ncbi:MAG: rhodanese-like domain-containing protein [Terracidiphilus sp.]
MRFGFFERAGVIGVLAAFFAAPTQMHAQGPIGAPSENSASSIPQAQVIQPEELNRMLQAEGAMKPLVLQVGSRVLFDQAHITGSEYAGPGSQAEGLRLLKKKAAPLARNAFIVLYCGCCPWNRCPNVAPAFRQLQGLGFTNVKVLYIAENFGADWASKGYPVERSR